MMSSQNEISRRAYLIRLRKLAKMALEKYGLYDVRLKFRSIAGNGIYRVIVPSESDNPSCFEPGQYNLRLHQPGYMKPEYISSEMEWLNALTDAGINVPQPYRNMDGGWITEVDGGFETPQARRCTLISWIDGRLPTRTLRPRHGEALGRVVGKMHTQSMSWKIPKGFARPHWDYEGLFGDGADYEFKAKDAYEAIPKNYKEALDRTLKLYQDAEEQLGKGKKVYGLIHADLGVDANVLFHAGEARPIDFDDCGFGYWLFDLGVALAHYFADIDNPNPKMQDAILEGYRETTPLSEIDLECIQVFTAARYAQLMMFYQGSATVHPQYSEQAAAEVTRYSSALKQLLNQMK